MMNEPCANPGTGDTSFGIMRILQCLPHRYPFLLVDRVTSCVPEEHITAYKNVSFNEPFFQGHFPELPVMPGVLIMEALAQAGGLMVLADWEQERIDKSIFLFSGMDGVKFRQPVRPGDRLDLECTLVRKKLSLWKMAGKAWVDGKLAAQGELTAAMTIRGEV